MDPTVVQVAVLMLKPNYLKSGEPQAASAQRLVPPSAAPGAQRTIVASGNCCAGCGKRGTECERHALSILLSLLLFYLLADFA